MKEACGEYDLGTNNTILLSNFTNLSSTYDPTPSNPCTHNNTEKICSTVHPNSNISAKSEKGLHTCSDNGISALGYMSGIVIASLSLNSELFRVDEVRSLLLLGILSCMFWPLTKQNLTIVSLMLCDQY